MADMYQTVAWGRQGQDEKFERLAIERNTAGDDDVTFAVKYCGICHTDVHFANNDMGMYFWYFLALLHCSCILILPCIPASYTMSDLETYFNSLH